MNVHISSQSLAYVEGRLSPDARARVEAHLVACAVCRSEVEDLRHLSDALSAVPRALDARLSARRVQQWAAMWARTRAGRPPARAPATGAPRGGRRDGRPHWRIAWGMAALMCVLFSASLVASPAQGNVLAASGPALAVIQTPATMGGWTKSPGGATLAAAVATTATGTLGPGQTPEPIPTGRKP